MNDGGPAFPCNDIDPTGNCAPASFRGMSLRDHFAGLAMAGLLSANDDREYAHCAEMSYRFADAMLREREAK